MLNCFCFRFKHPSVVISIEAGKVCLIGFSLVIYEYECYMTMYIGSYMRFVYVVGIGD